MALNLRIVSSSLWNNVLSLYKIQGRELLVSPPTPKKAPTSKKSLLTTDVIGVLSGEARQKNHPLERLK